MKIGLESMQGFVHTRVVVFIFERRFFGMKHSTRISPSDWHLVLCKPNQNHIAFRHLKALGFDLFMPRHQVDRRWRGCLRKDIVPVFAGYIFIATDPTRPKWHKVRTTPGVSRLIQFNNEAPATVPAGVVAGLMSRCDQDGLLQPMVEDLSVGDTVRIVSGPFYDFVTSIERVDQQSRLHVLLGFLGGLTRVQLDPSSVVKVTSG